MGTRADSDATDALERLLAKADAELARTRATLEEARRSVRDHQLAQPELAGRLRALTLVLESSQRGLGEGLATLREQSAASKQLTFRLPGRSRKP